MSKTKTYVKSIVIGIMAVLFFSCKDKYERVGEEAIPQVFPQGIAENFELTYTETLESLKIEDTDSSKVIAVLTSPLSKNFDNLEFPYRTFPDGLKVVLFDSQGNRNTIVSDYGIIYAATNIIDLQGNVVVITHDGKKLEAPQLYYDQDNEWIFTQEKFTFTNPEDGTIMDGEGMDFNKDLSFFNAHRTYGLMTIKEEKE
ncbi:LPS export ABC transporter periplasmic protein LptC [Maribacter sp. 2-571]|uniref:LPS export ABC transporter periplasmic protein LptC n=1 Tax=Maribacter sp. 2-571 TaxID=3417569 RepID=UPI003D33C487